MTTPAAPAPEYLLNAWEDVVPFIRHDPRFAKVDIVEMKRSRVELTPDIVLVSSAVSFPFAYEGCDNLLHALLDLDVRKQFLDDLHDLAFNGDESSGDSLLWANDGYHALAKKQSSSSLSDYRLIMGIQHDANLRRTNDGKFDTSSRHGLLKIRVDFALEPLIA